MFEERPASTFKKPFKKFSSSGGGGKGGFKKDTSPGELYKPFAVTFLANSPPEATEKLTAYIERFNHSHLTARTDGTTGIGDVLEKNMKKFEIILPWQDFNDKKSKFYFNTDQNKDVAKMFNSAFDTLKPAAQGFLARNVRLILGKDNKSPVLFAIVWSEDGAEKPHEVTRASGLLKHVLALANSLRIPVFNMQRADALSRMEYFLEKPPVPITTF